MPNLYIIAGCNGAGKSTASFSILPAILNCREFVNADSIAAGISPFNSESVAFEAGRIMLERIYLLMKEEITFAFETTLATKSYVSLVKKALSRGYEIDLFYFWLSSPELAEKRVAQRVSKGGHNISSEIIHRRYYRGIYNLMNLYIPIVSNWVVIDNMGSFPKFICHGTGSEKMIINPELWEIMERQSRYYGK